MTDLKLHPQGFSFMSPAIDAQEFIEDLRDVRAMESYNSHNLCESHAECSCGWKGETWIGADMSAPRMDGERHRYHQEKPNEHRVWTRSEWTAVGAPAEQEPSNEP